MTGVIQLILTIIPVGYLIKMVPESVKVGFANGLAIIIARAQIDVFKVPDWQASFNEMVREMLVLILRSGDIDELRLCKVDWSRT